MDDSDEGFPTDQEERKENKKAPPRSSTVYIAPTVVQKDVGLEDFQIIKKIGQGAFSKVFLVKKKETGEALAMKVIRKDTLLEEDSLVNTLLEKDILLNAEHPFLMSMNHVFQTEQKVFFVMRFARGGELF